MASPSGRRRKTDLRAVMPVGPAGCLMASSATCASTARPPLPRQLLPLQSLARRKVNGCNADGCSGCIVLHLECFGVARCPYRYYSNCEHDCDHDETSVERGQKDVAAAGKAKNRLHRRGYP
jgi:hypothetical protein